MFASRAKQMRACEVRMVSNAQILSTQAIPFVFLTGHQVRSHEPDETNVKRVVRFLTIK